MNRLLKRKKIVDEVIKPWERRRQAIVSELASLEEDKEKAAKKALSSLKYILSKAVEARNAFMQVHEPVVRSAEAHANELARLGARATRKQVEAVSTALQRLATKSKNLTISRQLFDASQQVVLGKFGKARAGIKKAIGEFNERTTRGLLSFDYRQDIAAALGSAHLFFSRTPGEHVKKTISQLVLARNAFAAGRLDETHKRILSAINAYSKPAAYAARLLRGEF